MPGALTRAGRAHVSLDILLRVDYAEELAPPAFLAKSAILFSDHTVPM
jgi:hypothetical protein